MANKNPFTKKSTPSVPTQSELLAKAELEEAMLREVKQQDSKGKIHRTTLEIPSDIYAQIEEIRSETELSLKGFFMVAAKKYIADYYSKK